MQKYLGFAASLLLLVALIVHLKVSAARVESTTTLRPNLSLAQRSSRYEVPHPAAAFMPTSIPTSTPTSTPTPIPTSTPTPTPRPILPGAGPEMPGTLLIQAERFDLYLGIRSLAGTDLLALLPRVELGLDAAQIQLGSGFNARTSVGVYQLARRPQKGLRALAYTDERRIELFYASEEDPDGAVRVILHELGHQLESDRYGPSVQRNADVILHEGLATWLAGAEWLARTDAASWQERAGSLRAAGRLLPIRRDPGGAQANDAYEGWAAFVDYLITTYGWPAFDDLYRSSSGRYPGSADYALVYGAALDTLVADWRTTLDS